MKVAVITAFAGRYYLFSLFAQNLLSVQEKFDYDFVNIAVGSEGEVSEKVATDSGFIYREKENYPLSEKFNQACLMAREHEADYVVVMGSGVLIDGIAFNSLLCAMGEGHERIGFRDCYFHSQKKLYYFPGYRNEKTERSIGTGRAIKNTLLEKFKWKPWPEDKHIYLDYSMDMKIGFSTEKLLSLKNTGGLIIGVKSEKNISPLSSYEGMLEDAGDINYLKRIPALSLWEKNF